MTILTDGIVVLVLVILDNSKFEIVGAISNALSELRSAGIAPAFLSWTISLSLVSACKVTCSFLIFLTDCFDRTFCWPS